MRNPYVGEGVDGARRSARIDREEADGLDPGEYRDAVLASAAAWDAQADQLEAEAGPVLEGELVTQSDDYVAGKSGWAIVDPEPALSPREQSARRLVAIAALEKLLGKLKAQEKSDGAWTRAGQKETVTLPDGQLLGNTRTDAVKGGWKVKDAGKWLAYVSKTDPDRIAEVTSKTVDPTWQARVLAAQDKGTAGPWLDLETGEETDTPPAATGLEYVPAGYKIVTTPDKDAAAAVAEFLGPLTRRLGLPELDQ